ncbi:MAG: hypothetical protein WBQ94_25270 [Terracidiphilus sp.]
MMNPKAWETISGFTANAKAATERLGKLGVYFPENKQQLAATAARIEAECGATMKSLLTEALTGVGSKIAEPDAKAAAKPARLMIDEAKGKRIRRLYLEELSSESRESYLAVEFDDDTEVVIDMDVDVVSRPSFGIAHHALDEDGDVRPLKDHIKGSISSLDTVGEIDHMTHCPSLARAEVRVGAGGTPAQ